MATFEIAHCSLCVVTNLWVASLEADALGPGIALRMRCGGHRSQHVPDRDLMSPSHKLKIKDALWNATVTGRSEIWPVHQRVAELGGHLRTGLEDTFYLPDGTKADSNGPLIEKLAEYARNSGREVASPQEARGMLGLKALGSSTAL